MPALNLSGHTWDVLSPSYLELTTHPVALAYNGRAWYLAFEGRFDGARPWPSRDEAAQAIAQAFIDHQTMEQRI